MRKHLNLVSCFAEINRGAAYEHPIAMQFLTNGPQVHRLTIEQAFAKACPIAHEEILVQTPYFLPPEGLLMSLCSAAMRGVHVCAMIPERDDSYLTQRTSDSHLAQPMQAGVDVRRYHGSFLRSKLMVVDRRIVGVGGANMNFRSLEVNLEVMASVYDRLIIEGLYKAFEVNLQSCRQLTLAEWDKHPLWIRSWEATARLFPPLL